MDTSEKYIKMCEMAEEIQNEWKLKAGDCVAYPPDRQNAKWNIEWYGENDADAWETKELKFEWDVIWLPRQDQLQEMVLSTPAKHWPRKYWNSIHVEFLGVPEIDSCSSWEQLWLAFVMHEKYEKHWNNENWIKDR